MKIKKQLTPPPSIGFMPTFHPVGRLTSRQTHHYFPTSKLFLEDTESFGTGFYKEYRPPKLEIVVELLSNFFGAPTQDSSHH